jgi:hypothetical protein
MDIKKPKDKYKNSIYNLVHLSKADQSFDGIYIDSKKLNEDIKNLWELYNEYQKLMNQQKSRIITNVIKAWENAGYNVTTKGQCLYLEYGAQMIMIDLETKSYYCENQFGEALPISLEEHELICKTLKINQIN